MQAERVGKRSYIFTQNLPQWNLNLHVILGNKRNYVIDTGLGSGSMEPVLELLRQSPRPVVAVNTHHHWDHVWGNAVFAEGIILSHWRCRELLIENWAETLAENRAYLCGQAPLCPPNLVFNDEVYFPQDGIRLFYSPGHTIDGISLYDEEDKVLNVGDNIGDTPMEIVPEIETDAQTYKKSLARYKALNCGFCVSGHNVVMGAQVFEQIEAKLGARPFRPG